MEALDADLRVADLDHDGLTNAAMVDTTMDDLFGEATNGLSVEGLGISLSNPPPPPSLISRIAEMQSGGCCTYVEHS